MSSLQELEHRSNTEQQRSANEATTEHIGTSKDSYEEMKRAAAAKRKKEKQIAETEAEIARLEDEQKRMEALLAEPSNQTQDNFQKYEHIKREIEQKMYEWEILSDI